MRVDPGGTYTSGAGGQITINNTGTLNVDGGTFTAEGDLTLTSGGTLTIDNGGALTANGNLDNSMNGNSNLIDGTLTIETGTFTPNSGAAPYIIAL